MAKEKAPKLQDERNDNSKPKGLYCEATFTGDEINATVKQNNLNPAQAIMAIKAIQDNLEKIKSKAKKELGL